ncbi:hypothetical protein ACROYT_G044170 [Oculina patagonica]
MEKLRLHYTGSTGSSLMADRFKFWGFSQSPNESVQAWEVKIRQAGSLCSYGAHSDEMYRNKFVFGLHNDAMQAKLLKTHLKVYNTAKSMGDVVTEAKALETAHMANKLIADSTKSTTEEQVHWVGHKEMKLSREPGTWHWCGKGVHGKWTTTATTRTTSPTQQTQQRPQLPTNRPLQFSEDEPTDFAFYPDDYQEQCYSLETHEVHNVIAQPPKKRYFVKLLLSATGSSFTPVTGTLYRYSRSIQQPRATFDSW